MRGEFHHLFETMVEDHYYYYYYYYYYYCVWYECNLQ